MAPRNSPTGTWRNSNLDFTGNTLPVLRSSFAPTLRRGRKDLLPAPSYNPWVPPYPVPPGQSGKPYRDNWDVNRAVSSAFTKSVWVYRAVKAISDNAARIPVCFRVGSRWDGDIIDQHPLLDRFNYQTSPYEQAYIFRKRLSQQVLLNKQGAFIEVVRSNMGDPLALYLLPAGYTWPVPSEQTFVSAYRVQMPGKAWFDIPAENVIWIREPHPTDPYSGLTPLECAGIDVEIDWYARLYNRNFLQNDGRPGGLLVLKGDVMDDDMDELRRRFLGPTGSAVMGAGRVSVIEGDQASFLDTASSPREAAYTEARETSGEQILMAFGVPESIAGNASDRTFENADQERENFWRETMLDHLSLIGNALDVLDPDPKIFYTFDLASVSVLQRDRITNLTFALQEVKGSVRTPNEYRAMTGELEPLGPDDGTGGADQLYMLTTEASITGGSVNPGMMQQITHGVTSAVSAALPAGFEAPALSAGTPGEAEHPSLAGASWRRSRVAAKSLDPIQIVNEESAEDDSGDNAALRAARLVANQAGILTPDSPSFPVHADHFAERGGAPQERQRYRQVDSKVASTAHTWAMVCFDPPEAVCDQLAESGSEAAEVLHITLGVIPMTVLDTPAKIGMLQGAVAAFASSAPALSMRIAGLGRFHNEAPGTTDAVVALIDSVGITETRTRLAHALTSAGFAFDSTHGFTPHLTLSYLDGDDDDPVALPPTLTWVQETLTVAIGDDWTDYAFGGAAIDWKVYHLEPQK